MTNIDRINVGPRMSDVVIHNGVAYLAGKVPRDLTGDIAAQTKDVLETIDALLQQAGTARDRILRAEIYLKDIAQWADMNKVWDAWIPPGATPARATVEARMARPECLVEIVITAAI